MLSDYGAARLIRPTPKPNGKGWGRTLQGTTPDVALGYVQTGVIKSILSVQNPSTPQASNSLARSEVLTV
ncbi:hypothetical protein CLU90_4929 [Janthinobacterium sp. 67]|nr:hypothetical protein CLU90_4929 [Janthinobacterium sp. 67]